MKSTILLATTIVGGLFSTPLMAATADMGFGYTILNGDTLVRIKDLSDPSKADLQPLSGDTTNLDAITYRPNTREFFGYDDASDAIYFVDVGTGATTLVVGSDTTTTPPEGTSTSNSSIDFNNAADAARFVSASDENNVFFPADSSASSPAGLSPDIIRVTDLFYADGDANDGVDPTIIGNAYIGALPQALAQANNGGTQFAIDSGTNALVTLGNNAGTLDTLGSLVDGGTGIPIDFGDLGALDVLTTAPGDDLGVAVLSVGGSQGLFSFDLGVDADGNPLVGDVTATFLGALDGSAGSYSGLAVAPVPLPMPALMLLAGLGALGAAGRRRMKRG